MSAHFSYDHALAGSSKQSAGITPHIDVSVSEAIADKVNSVVTEYPFRWDSVGEPNSVVDTGATHQAIQRVAKG